MAKIIRKLDTGEEVKGFELDTEMKLEFDFEGKALGDDEIEMIGTTGGKDRDGEVIDPMGLDIKAFKKNPVILPQHNYGRPAIGKATRIKMQDGKLIFKIQFPEDGINPEADVYRKLYKSGFMSASSIGFIPREWEDGDGKKSPYRTYTKSELLELSLVSVPANSEALVVARSKGIISDDEAKLIETKDADLGTIIVSEHQVIHNALDATIADFKNRLMYVEGFVAGLQKKRDAEIQKGYIQKLLGGDRAERTENHTDTTTDDIKKLFKGE